MVGQVETLLLPLFADARPSGEGIGHKIGDHRDHTTPDDGDNNALDLFGDLGRDAHGFIEPGAAHEFGCAQTGQGRPNNAANAVHPEDVEAVVIAEGPFYCGGGQIAQKG